ncbi:hypothetical protein BGV68_04035 [Burkholderia ubonensis]|nr:hypothetical protein BGV68_04035 [Burkholderia ubonensis]
MAGLSHWVLEQACRRMRAWRDEGVAPLMMAINLSLCELDSAGALVRDVTNTVAKWRPAPSDLEFDVTEATLTRLAWAHNDVLRALREPIPLHTSLLLKLARVCDAGSKIHHSLHA